MLLPKQENLDLTLKSCISQICSDQSETAQFDENGSFSDEFLYGSHLINDRHWEQINSFRQKKYELVKNFQKKIISGEIDLTNSFSKLSRFKRIEEFITGRGLFNYTLYYENGQPKIKIDLLSENHPEEDKKIIHGLFDKFATDNDFIFYKLYSKYLDFNRHIQDSGYQSIKYFFKLRLELISDQVKQIENELTAEEKENIKSAIKGINNPESILPGYPKEVYPKIKLLLLTSLQAKIGFIRRFKDMEESELRLFDRITSSDQRDKIEAISKFDFSKVYHEGSVKTECQKAYASLEKWAPSVSDKYEFDKMVKDSKEIFKTWSKLFFSTETYQNIAPAIDNFKVAHPHTKAKYLSIVSELLNKNFNEISQKSLIDELETITLNNSDFDLERICDTYQFSPLIDNARGNSISMSSYSVKYKKFGQGILLHELAHAVSAVFQQSGIAGVSKEVLDSSRSCVSQSHPESRYGKNIKFEGDTHWTEEDWADLVSSMIIKDMDAESRETNYFCAMVNPNKHFTRADLEYSDDTHSPKVIRLINHEKRVTNSIPEECKEITKVNMCKF